MTGMTWNPMHGVKRHSKPKYMREASPPPEREKVEHSQGWPHYDRKGNCICLCKRCMGPAGCICPSCAGKGHANCDKGDYLLTQGSKTGKVQA